MHGNHLIQVNNAEDVVDVIMNHKELFKPRKAPWKGQIVEVKREVPFIKGKIISCDLDTFPKEDIAFNYNMGKRISLQDFKRREYTDVEFIEMLEKNIDLIEQTESIKKYTKVTIVDEDFIPTKTEEENEVYMRAKSYNLLIELQQKHKDNKTLKKLLALFN